MAKLSEKQLHEAAQRLIDAHAQADIDNEWTFFVDSLYAPNCVYTCRYGGTMEVVARGREEIKATHYGRDMQVGWEDWTFPYQGVYVGPDSRLITHWMNRGPGLRSDGSHYETPGISFLRLDESAQIVEQLDVFDICHQMRLCDELEAAGLLAAELKVNWVEPTKARIRDTLRL